MCHGDPATSLALWGNDRGLDCTGAKMENWHEGEVHGAFEVVQSLAEADARTNLAICKGAALVVGFVAVSGVLFFVLITRSVTRPLGETVQAFQVMAEGDLSRRLPEGSHDEVGQFRNSANLLLDKLRDMIGRLSRSAAQLGTASASSPARPNRWPPAPIRPRADPAPWPPPPRKCRSACSRWPAPPSRCPAT